MFRFGNDAQKVIQNVMQQINLLIFFAVQRVVEETHGVGG